MKTGIRLISHAVYIDGQTDGMKRYEKRMSNGGVVYTYAANIRDAKLHFKTKN